MKTRILAPVLALVATWLAGCGTTPHLAAPTTGQLVALCKTAAYVGTKEALRAHPEYRAGFVAASAQLKALADSPTLDVTSLTAIAYQLPVKELKSERAQILVTGATILLSSVDVPTIPAERIEKLKPVALAIAAGIDLAAE